VTGEWRKLHNEEFNDLYSSPNIVQVIKSRNKWAGKRRVVCRFLRGNLRERDHLREDNIKMDSQEVGCWYVD
jgi:hypothetical protein